MGSGCPPQSRNTWEEDQAILCLLPHLLHQQGIPFQTALDLANGWVKEFVAIEGGVEVQPQQLADFFLDDADDAIPRTHRSWLDHLPSYADIERAIGKTRIGSAPGPDGISVDLLRMLPGFAALHLFALFLKSALRIQSPLQFRGGYLFELYKGKGPQSDMSKYRSILLADCIGKLPARAKNIHDIAQVVTDGDSIQCRGTPGLGT